MKGFVRKTLAGWVPADEKAQVMHKKHKLGEMYRADMVMPRNYRHHCLFMALLDLTFQNQSEYTNERMFRRAVALAAGHVDQFVSLDGTSHLVPLAYSYDEIPDEAEFDGAFHAAMVVCAKILHNMDLAELEAQVNRHADEHFGRAVA
jgi:hypothetical protein